MNEQFFEHLKLLRNKYKEKPQYNLFSVLRSSSDEVRLHSRFLADILNPKGAHNYGDTFLNELLQRLSISPTSDLQVDCEYKNIDILIRSQDTAIIIENKIYAGDQDKQLQRYHQAMTDEGYSNIHLFYLTLDGKDASELSIGKLQSEVTNLSYIDDISPWIRRCTEIAVRDAPLREALIQYTILINNLTHRVDNMEHVNQLKKLLLAGENLYSIAEINQAYEEIVIDSQVAMWELLGNKMTERFGDLSNDSISKHHDIKSRVKKYVQVKRNSKYIIQEIPLRNYPSFYLFVEQSHHLYFGIYFKDSADNIKEKELPKRDHSYTDFKREDNTFWTYPKKMINFRNITADDVKFLSTPSALEGMVDQIIEEMTTMLAVYK